MSDQVDIQALLYGLGETRLVTLPSGKTATVREMTGKEQRSFSDRTKLMNGSAINELLSACTDTINEESLPADPAERLRIINNLLSGDRECLLFNIRLESLGKDFTFASKCPNCGKKGEWEVDLSDAEAFPVTPYPMGDERILEYDSEVRRGLKIRCTLMDGNAENKAIKKRNTADTLTDLEMRVPQVFNPTTNSYMPIVLNRVGDAVLAELRKKVEAAEGFQDSKVSVTCVECGQQAEFDLIRQPDFLIPSVIS